MNDWNDIATALEKLAEKMGGETVKDARLNDIKRIHAALNNISEKYAPCECDSGSGSGSGGGSGSGSNVAFIYGVITPVDSSFAFVPSSSYSEIKALIDAEPIALYAVDTDSGTVMPVSYMLSGDYISLSIFGTISLISETENATAIYFNIFGDSQSNLAWATSVFENGVTTYNSIQP